jgi:hypothetical protein
VCVLAFGALACSKPVDEPDETACEGNCTSGAGGGGGAPQTGPLRLRVGHFNIRECSTDKIINPQDEELTAAAEVIARFAPDIVDINELQYDIENLPVAGMPGVPMPAVQGAFDGGAQNARRLADRVQANNPDAQYNDTLTTLGNSGFYWQGDTLGESSFVLRGWGEWRGRHNTGVLSRYPILRDQVRIITDFAWEDLPGNSIAAMTAATGIAVPSGFPLFEKSLNIIPIQVEEHVLYLVLLHPVPPAFEAINPYRNHDELLGLSLFLQGALPGVEPLPADAKYIVMGDLNADPEDGDGSIAGAIEQVIDNPAVVAWFPSGAGFKGQNGQYNTYLSGCGYDDGSVVTDPSTRWQMQLDYILPAPSIGTPLEGAVFWPDHEQNRPDFDLACRASDHKFLYADIELQ